MCEAPQTGSNLKRVFDRIECKWFYESALDLNELDKDLQVLRGLIVKNTDNVELNTYIKNKDAINEDSFKSDNSIPILVSFTGIVLTIYQFYDKIIDNIIENFNKIDNIEEITFCIAYFWIPILIIVVCALIIIYALWKQRKASKMKKFYTICLNTLWPQLPPKNEVNNSQNLRCSVKTNTKHKKNKK